jgi:penicillin-binding protein 2
MTSYPTYDANIFSSVIPESLWTAISTDTTHPLLNRPLSGQYPPGSTVKFITVGAALEEHLITPRTLLKPCLGGYRFGNRVFHCWDLGGHGSVTAAHSLEVSCDIYMYQLGQKLGVDLLSEYFDKCGFGYKTGVDVPGEVAGLNPNSTYYDERYGKNKWTTGLVLNNSIGQGEILSTPLQLAQFFCGLANNGVVYRPHVVNKITRSTGEVERTVPEEVFRLPFSPSTMEVLLEGMRLVVEGEHGTAKSLRNLDYTIGGKTGTAQNPHGLEHSLFVGVAPLEAPEIVVCAVVENAGHGSEVAAPVVGQVIRAYMLKKLGRDEVAAVDVGGQQ